MGYSDLGHLPFLDLSILCCQTARLLAAQAQGSMHLA